MKCEKCGVEMIVHRVKKAEDGRREVVYACRNKNCPAFEKTLRGEHTEKNETN